jgi:2-iminobutanoate/2-iminopropanoate deaminase
MRKVIATSEAPTAVGPYSQAVAVGNTLYCAGQIPLDPVSGDLVAGGVTEQTTRVLENVGGVLRANGMDYSHVVKATVFMTDLAHFADMNAVYAKYFHSPFPARSTIQVVALPRGAQVEIEVVAVG